MRFDRFWEEMPVFAAFVLLRHGTGTGIGCGS